MPRVFQPEKGISEEAPEVAESDPAENVRGKCWAASTRAQAVAAVSVPSPICDIVVSACGNSSVSIFLKAKVE